jgi:hypothetical protein
MAGKKPQGNFMPLEKNEAAQPKADGALTF